MLDRRPAPYGYQVIAAPDGKKKLAIQPEEAEVVRFLFTNYLSESIGMKELAPTAAPEKHSNPLRQAVAIHDVARHPDESNGSG